MRILTSLSSILLASLATSSLVACTTMGDDGLADSSDDASVAGTFDFWQADNGSWYFHLAAGNGQTLLTSEGYTDRTGAISGALSVMRNGTSTNSFQLEAASNGGYLLLLRAENNAIIATSQVYSTKSNATRAITTCSNAIGGYITKHDAVGTGVRVQLNTNAAGQVEFDIHAANGQIVLSSQEYASLASAYNGAFSVQDSGTTAANYTLAESATGTWSFTLSAANHEVIGTSQAYTTKESALAGEASVMSVVPSLDVF